MIKLRKDATTIKNFLMRMQKISYLMKTMLKELKSIRLNKVKRKPNQKQHRRKRTRKSKAS